MSVFTYRMLALRFPEACDQIIDTGSAPEGWTFDPERGMYCLEGETWPVMTLGLIEARRDTRTCCRCNTLEKKPLAPTRLPSTRGITLDAWAPEGVRVSAGRAARNVHLCRSCREAFSALVHGFFA